MFFSLSPPPSLSLSSSLPLSFSLSPSLLLFFFMMLIVYLIHHQVETTEFTQSQSPGITFHSLSLRGAVWDHTQEVLIPASSSTSTNVCVTVIPTTATSSDQERPSLYACPVYTTRRRNHLLFHVFLSSSHPSIQASLHCLDKATTS